MKRLSILSLVIAAWLALVLLACNLSSPPPPTLVPRATVTPQPTIGYATLSPDQFPNQATALPQVSNTALLNMLNQVQADRLLVHIDSLQRLGTRHINSPNNQPNNGIGAARSYIAGQFEQIKAGSQGRFTLIPHSFPVTFEGVSSNAENVVGYLAGREAGAGVVLIGAHYDSVSTNPSDGTAYAPGANDNASGVAALIEIARIMSANPQPPRSSVLFVAFSAEEIGRVGSKTFVADYIIPYNIPMAGMINLDIIGSQTGPDGSINDRELRVYSAGPNESISRQLARGLSFMVGQYMPDLQLTIQDANDREGRYSDHMSFDEAGFAAVRFIEPLEDVNRQHTAFDTIEDVQGNYLRRSTQATLISAATLADGPRPPRNVVVRDLGNGQRQLVWEPMPDAVSYVVVLRYPDSLTYNQYFETGENSVTSEIFTFSRLAGVAIAGRDANGLLGPLSAEYFITG